VNDNHMVFLASIDHGTIMEWQTILL